MSTPEQKDQAHLGPLSQEKIRNIIALKNAYSEFWENVKFSKGWDLPVAVISDVLHLIEEAAEIVIRIRSYLDSHNPAPKFRIIDGSAKEYLWNLEKMPKDSDFIRDLVHATLRHSTNYVEGLTGQKVDNFIKEIQNYNTSHQADKLALDGKVLSDNIIKLWNETDVLLKVNLSQEEKYYNPSLIKDLNQLSSSINNIKQRILLIQKKRDFNVKRETETKEQEAEQKRIEAEKEAAIAKENEEERKRREAEENSQKEAKARQEEEESRKRAATEKDREGLLKITAVAKEAEQIEKELKEISDIASKVKTIKKPSEAIDKLSDLKKRCVKNSSKLMQDLLILDELVGLQQSRTAKKEQVTHIQHLLDSAETIKSKINSLEVEIQPLVTQQQKQEAELDRIADEELAHLIEEKNHPKPAVSTGTHENKPQTTHPIPAHTTEPAPHPGQPAAAVSKELEKPKAVKMDSPIQKIHPDSELPIEGRTVIPIQHPQRRNETVAHPRFDLKKAWSNLRLDPKVEIYEGPEEYTIMANIPGIHKDEIETTILPDGTLQLSGVRVPTPEEINLLRRQIHSRYTPQSDEEEDMLVLKLGVGRFGRFVKKFKLPTDLLIDQIHGQYKDGIVYIGIPKPKQTFRRASHHRDSPNPFFPFMNDVPFWGASPRYY